MELRPTARTCHGVQAGADNGTKELCLRTRWIGTALRMKVIHICIITGEKTTHGVAPNMRYLWESHLEDLGRSRVAIQNKGAGNCLPYAVRDILRQQAQGVWSVPALRALVVRTMREAPTKESYHPQVWMQKWCHTMTSTEKCAEWERLIAAANPAHKEYMWFPHVRALAVGLGRTIVVIPTKRHGRGGGGEQIRVFHTNPSHGEAHRGVIVPRGFSDCNDRYSWVAFMEYWRTLPEDECANTIVILHDPDMQHYLGTSIPSSRAVVQMDLTESDNVAAPSSDTDSGSTSALSIGILDHDPVDAFRICITVGAASSGYSSEVVA